MEGVIWRKNTNRWQVSINGKHLGYRVDKEEAHLLRFAAEQCLEVNRLSCDSSMLCIYCGSELNTDLSKPKRLKFCNNDCKCMYRKTNPYNIERRRANQRAYLKNNKDSVTEKAREYASSDRGKASKRAFILKKYKLSEEDYNSMFAGQGGLCKICGKILGTPRIDHDHSSGKVRGLLCHSCNVGIGFLQDSASLCKIAHEYLLSYE